MYFTWDTGKNEKLKDHMFMLFQQLSLKKKLD